MNSNFMFSKFNKNKRRVKQIEYQSKAANDLMFEILAKFLLSFPVFFNISVVMAGGQFGRRLSERVFPELS